MTYANPDLLIGTDALERRLRDPDLRIFDTTVHLDPHPERGYTVRSGREDYEAGHVPGAGFLDLQADLSDQSTDLPFTRSPVPQLEQSLSRAGIGPGARVVVYSTGHVMWAARVWWMLRALGFESAAVLDGGFAKWRREERPIATEPCLYPAAQFKAAPRPSLWADADEVERSIESSSVCTINALPREIFTGESRVHYGRRGHIAGSQNVPFAGTLDPSTGTFLPAQALRRAFEPAGAFERERVITYCGGGISAAQNAFALVLLGHPDVAVYDGSLAEWSRDPAKPMRTGEPR